MKWALANRSTLGCKFSITKQKSNTDGRKAKKTFNPEWLLIGFVRFFFVNRIRSILMGLSIPKVALAKKC